MDGRSERDRMLAGEPYRAVGPEIEADRRRARALMRAYDEAASAAADAEGEARAAAILGELLGAVGEGTVVRPPFRCDYGHNIRLGRGVFLNYGCVFLDVVAIEVGDLCQIGPGVQVYAADHPRDPALRRQGLELGRPVRVGANVWIGGGAILLPGVSVGEDAVIGAGAVVTRDVPPGARVAGNPARPVGARPRAGRG
jgi:maltose O-acetyltransferase